MIFASSKSTKFDQLKVVGSRRFVIDASNSNIVYKRKKPSKAQFLA